MPRSFLFLAAFSVFLFPAFSSAQNSEVDENMKEAFVISALLMTAAQNSGNEVVHVEMDLVFKQTTRITYRQLNEGYTYLVAAMGQATKVEDLDLKVYKIVNGQPVLIANDNKVNYEAKLAITPSSTGLYLFEISAYKFKYPYTAAVYSLIIAHNVP